MSWLEGPLAAYDSETTGVRVEEDRIVTASLIKATVKTEPVYSTWLLNPGIPIPPEATAVHGITDEEASEGWAPAEALHQINQDLQYVWSQGAPVVIYNAPFDLTLLDREMRRHLGYGLEVSGPVIDPLVLDKAVDQYRKGSRKLMDTCAHYNIMVPAEDAHRSEGDARAALRLAWVLINRHVIPGNPGTDYEDHPLRDLPLDDLHQFQAEAYHHQRTSFHAYLAKKGEAPDDANTTWPLKPWNGDSNG